MRALRALDWNALDDALEAFEGALPHLDAFARSHGRAGRERATYGRLIDRWRRQAGAAGLDVCTRFGFSY